MSTKNFYTNDAIYLRFELNYYTEIVVDLNKVQFLFGHPTRMLTHTLTLTTLIEQRPKNTSSTYSIQYTLKHWEPTHFRWKLV